EARPGMKRAADVAVYGGRSAGQLQGRRGQPRQTQRFRRVIAFMRHSDQIAAGPDGEESLGGARKQADDPQRHFNPRLCGNNLRMEQQAAVQNHVPSKGERSREILATLARHGLSAATGHPAAEQLRLACEELGTTFIKLGQSLSTRADLLSESYRVEL